MGSRISLKALTLLSEGELQRFSKQLTYCSAAPDVPDIQSPKDTEMTWLSEVSVLVQIAVVQQRYLLEQQTLLAQIGEPLGRQPALQTIVPPLHAPDAHHRRVLLLFSAVARRHPQKVS